MSVQPTGRLEQREGTSHVVLERTFRAPIEDVWAAVTEPGRLERWIGTYAGDPATGEVAFRMTAEGDQAPEERMEIRACTPPRHLALTSHTGEGSWQLDLRLREEDGTTLLEFAQASMDPVEAESVGPGWEYYLDRLVAAETGGDPSSIDFEADYYPAMSTHYRGLFSQV
ncbi:MAG TPA: SRPBCC family protein [Marmoricola sp.]|nr:SRPBCC family protein [Marmoricola sp.]